MLCAWLLVHVQWRGLLVAGALGVLGAAITVFRPPAAAASAS